MSEITAPGSVLNVLELRRDQVPTVRAWRSDIATLRLPEVPDGVTWEHLRLQVRTEKRVRTLARTPQDLHRLSVGDLMSQYGFGRESLLDLLKSLRAVVAGGYAFPTGREEPVHPEALDIEVEKLPASLVSLPTEISSRYLPSVPPGLSWRDLELRVRTENRVRQLAATPEELCRVTVGELAKLSGFGKKSLGDLLGALRRFGTILQAEERYPDRAKNWEVVRVARELRRNRAARRIVRDDHRFGALIRAIDPDAKTAAEVGMRLSDGTTADSAKRGSLPSLSKLVSAIRRARQLLLEEELAEFLGSEPGKRNQQMVALYLGWDGGGGTTLDYAGRKFGLTRERVRQISARILQRLSGHSIFAPVLDSVLEFVERHMPLPAAVIESKLRHAGYTKLHFRLEGVLSAAEHLGRPVRFVVGDEPHRMVARPRDHVVQAIVRPARRSVRRWGVATIADTSSQVGRTAPRLSDEALVARILGAEADFRWLDEARGWFWFYDPLENSLFTRIRKVLSVTPRVSPSELRAAISRDRRMRGFAPPKGVLLELCRQAPWCRVEDDSFVVADPPLSRGQVLSPNEALIAEVLEAHGGVAEGLQLERLCVGYGMSRSTFWALASGSAIVTRYAPGLYGLVGAPIAPGVLGQRAPIRRKGRVVVDYGWRSDRTIWVAYCLSGSMIRSGVFSLPAAMSRFLQGEYSLHAYDGASIANVTVRGGSGWSLARLYQRRGGEAGDSLVLVFDSVTRQATAYLGQPELIDEFRSGGEVSATGDRSDGA